MLLKAELENIDDSLILITNGEIRYLATYAFGETKSGSSSRNDIGGADRTFASNLVSASSTLCTNNGSNLDKKLSIYHLRQRYDFFMASSNATSLIPKIDKICLLVEMKAVTSLAPNENKVYSKTGHFL